MKKLIYLFYFLVIITPAVFAQNVGINNTGATPNNSTILDLNTGNTFTGSNGKGILIPSVSLTGATDATTIGTGNVTSLMVYNIATAGASPNNVVPGYYYWNGSRWLQLVASGGSTGNTVFSGFQVFTTSGTFALPAGVTRVMIEMWGGGGGGGGSTKGGTGWPGSGGGGGAYAKSLFNVTSNITVVVGTGGAGGAAGANNGASGTATSVSGGAVLTAGGGTGGKGADNLYVIAAGGVPTTTSASSLGINGYQGGAQIGGGTGGPGGSAPSGGAGGQPNGLPGYAGSVPGGGGGGASNDGSANYAGGAGAAGLVIIWW